MKKYTFILLAAGMLLAAGCTKSTTPTISTNTTNTIQSEQVATGISMAQVTEANSATKCWTVISGSVYDLTDWIKQHPGGDQQILGICGKDGTAAFNGQHSGDSQPAQALAQFKIGTLAQ